MRDVRGRRRAAEEMSDRVKGESYCLLENYGPGRPSQQWPGLDRERGRERVIDYTPLKDTSAHGCQRRNEAVGRQESDNVVDRNIMEKSARR